MSKSQVTKLDKLARIRLSKHFFLRDFLYSETAAVLGVNNIPDDIELAVAAGMQLCEKVLEPIQGVWGRIHIRSAFRSCEVNQRGNELGANCTRNEGNYAYHIWDKRDKQGFMGAAACIIVPTYLDYYEKTGDWTSLAWWIHANIPEYSDLEFFPNLCAFNVSWHEDPKKLKQICSHFIDPKTQLKSKILNAGIESDYYRPIPLKERHSACSALIDKSIE